MEKNTAPIRVTARLDRRTHARLKSEAHQKAVSLSWLLKHIIRTYPHHESLKKKPKD